MDRARSFLGAAALVVVASLVVSGAPRVHAEPPAPGPAPAKPPAAAGPVYKNAAVGISVTGPQGWTLTSTSAEAVSWRKLAVFAAPGTQVEVTVSQRDRTVASLAALHGAVQKEWEADKSFNLAGVRTVEPTALRPVGMVQVEATQIRQPPAPAPRAPGAPATPAAGPAAAPVLWHLLVTYVMAQRYEVLVYATGPAASWPRTRAGVQALLDSITLAAPPRGAEG